MFTLIDGKIIFTHIIEKEFVDSKCDCELILIDTWEDPFYVHQILNHLNQAGNVL